MHKFIVLYIHSFNNSPVNFTQCIEKFEGNIEIKIIGKIKSHIQRSKEMHLILI